jgi:exopolyphosphatase/guanosine-5'-triphosphate,3'-diphosphate pyrophosphatase
VGRKVPVELFDSRPEWLRLAVLLRLAVVLRRSRQGQHLPHIEVAAAPDALTIRLPRSWLNKHPLTRLDLEQEAGYLKAAQIELLMEELA